MHLSPFPYLILILLPSIPLIHPQPFIFTTFTSPVSPPLTLNGIANITADGILKLTNASSHQIGRCLYSNPIQFKSHNKSLSFSTAFVFSIVPNFKKLGGHGFAFTISPTKDFTGAQPSQYLGLLNVTLNGNASNHLFAVEFDTVQDFEFSDINNNHVGVNVNKMKSVNSSKAGFFVDGNLTKQDLCLHSGKKIQAWIDYDAEKTELNVTLSLFSNKPNTPIISLPVDLSPVFQEYMYVGFSASTGVLRSSHYIYGWSFNMSGKAESLDVHQLPSLSQINNNNKKKKMKTGVKVLFSGLVILGGLIVVIVVICVVKKLKKTEAVEDWELDLGPRPFSYKELKDATKGFHEKQMVGFGGSGKVYKGVLSESKMVIAVKRISKKSKQGQKEFLSEISTIGRLRHRSLVQLLGWSRNKGELLLVYDFMANGSLDKYVYMSNGSKVVLNWEQRFKIINDVSYGLVYLHEEWEQTVLHRDVKAGNVLLDSDLNGRLGDFGLAKLYDHDSNSNVPTTRVVGTLGYLAPELTRTGKPTTSSDVYAFGALLLEVVCGRRPIETKASPEEMLLVDWVWDKWREGCLVEVVDWRLKGEYNETEVVMVLKLGLMCSRDEASLRPSMRQVVRYLSGEVPLPEALGSTCDGGVVKVDDCITPMEKIK
ncbi:hypothetical protein QVD17_31326 [Tagetes erecta]|uniref:non-specific serine/threonine protein kinase n=1 Tax=Tagetes erecta TaxID=13708 RepID=A0AAD8K445_TARER|nr:hypothetical protein QVD17_31326 [Tagetes erecta]